MNNLKLLLCLAAAAGLANCGDRDVSTRDVEVAAIAKARETLALDAGVPLKATVWTGRESDGQMTYCGSVQGQDASARAVPPQRFATHGDPMNFFIFEDAHRRDVPTQPGKFENWSTLCSGTQAA